MLLHLDAMMMNENVLLLLHPMDSPHKGCARGEMLPGKSIEWEVIYAAHQFDNLIISESLRCWESLTRSQLKHMIKLSAQDAISFCAHQMLCGTSPDDLFASTVVCNK